MTAATQSPPSILVVEDDVLVRDMIVAELAYAGFEVLWAASAEEALALDTGRIALLFTDIRLPGMNGWTLAEHIRVRHPGLPVIYASGYSDRLEPLPHSRFLQKPYLPSQVLRTAEELGIKLPHHPAS
jgi:CheY-like chemotaxis protein